MTRVNAESTIAGSRARVFSNHSRSVEGLGFGVPCVFLKLVTQEGPRCKSG